MAAGRRRGKERRLLPGVASLLTDMWQRHIYASSEANSMDDKGMPRAIHVITNSSALSRLSK
jgi:hypothetical protein